LDGKVRKIVIFVHLSTFETSQPNPKVAAAAAAAKERHYPILIL